MSLNWLNRVQISSKVNRYRPVVPSTMTSMANGGSSRLLVGCCCFITFFSVAFYSVGFMRLAWELRAHNDRILALEVQDRQKTTTDTPLFESKLPKGKSDCLFLVSCSYKLASYADFLWARHAITNVVGLFSITTTFHDLGTLKN